MVFLALYIEAKVHFPRPSQFLKVLIQACLILIGMYTGFTRVSDYKHHWSDVLAGFFLGTLIAFIIIFRLLRPRFTKPVSQGAEEFCVGNLSEHNHSKLPHEDIDIEATSAQH